MRSAIDHFLPNTHIGYLTMEIALRSEMHSYSGGLGVLAGDTARSCADLEIPAVFVSLISREGYLRQEIDEHGRQVEKPDPWRPEDWSTPLDAMVAVELDGRPVWIRPWLHVLTCPAGHSVPVILLDTDLDQNSPADRELTHYLYGGDERYRLKQEAILGIGGGQMLRALGFDIHTYHLNEGHAALLTIALLRRFARPPSHVGHGESPYDVDRVLERCVFTTHTPVESGHDRFAYDLVEQVLGDFIDIGELKKFAGTDVCNMTRLALNLSGYINGVARRHAETAEHMFPGYQIHAVTNGIHVGTWTHVSFARLYQTLFPHWWHEPEVLVRADQIPDNDVWQAHSEAKAGLLDIVKQRTGVALDPEVMLIGFARRMTSYKRPDLLFADIERLRAINRAHPFQVVFAGKAHPLDWEGKRLIEEINGRVRELGGEIRMAFLPDYDMDLAASLIAGADVWLNTPLPPLEASGTSGMKAAVNGVLNLSVLDGWWGEAWIEDTTGWAIGEDRPAGPDGTHGQALYDKLEKKVLPLYYDDHVGWVWMMKQSIGKIAYYFNSQRMMRRYATEAYLR